MDMRLLRYFVACVECKNMHAAAETVHVSQHALSKAIAELEAEIGENYSIAFPATSIQEPTETHSSAMQR